MQTASKLKRLFAVYDKTDRSVVGMYATLKKADHKSTALGIEYGCYKYAVAEINLQNRKIITL